MSKISFNYNRPIVCIQGLGFVGMAMAIAVADAMNEIEEPYFNVIGVDLPNPVGLEKIEMVNKGHLPIVSNDPELKAAFDRVVAKGNLKATSEPEVYQSADIVVVDIHLDVIELEDGTHTASFGGFRKALQTSSRI